jgi:NAD(P)-dependent dehydrogenase (short-subunit alcohol dehydrogenase family)
MDFSLKGKTAIVVGGSKGLGFGMASGLAQAGANVVLVSRNQDQLDAAAAKMTSETSNENVVGFATDITSLDNINGLIDKVCNKFGQIDILINSAGVNKRFAAIDFTEEDWDIVQNTQLKYVFFMCQAVAKQMIEKGIKGKIINIASLTSELGLPNMISYCAAKGAIVQITKAMANEWAQYGICVNAIGPGYYETEMTGPLFKDKKRVEELFARIPQKRFGLPSDLSGAAVFLASEASDYVTGQVLYVDGGFLCC